MHFVYLLLILILTFVSTQGRSQVLINSIDSQTLYSYQWNLFDLQHVDLYKLDWSRFPNLLFFPGEPGKLKGKSGCAQLDSQFKLLGKDKIRFFNLDQSKVECLDSDVDSEFRNMLGRVDQYAIQNNELRLFGNGVMLARFYAEFTHMTHYSMPVLAGNWILQYLSGPNDQLKPLFPIELPTLTFSDAHPEKITGFTGCNYFSANFKVQPSIIKFSSPTTISNRNCETGGEEALINTLLSVTAYWAIADELIFWKDGKGVLIFERKNSVVMDSSGAAWRFRERKSKNTIYVCPIGWPDRQ